MPSQGQRSPERESGAVRFAAPSVQGDRLMAHVSKLLGERYWAKDRATTRQRITEILVASGWEVQEQAFPEGVNLVATYGKDQTKTAGTQAEPNGPVLSQVLVGAHYDTVQGSPGADDNATGVALLLELAALYDERYDEQYPNQHPGQHPGQNSEQNPDQAQNHAIEAKGKEAAHSGLAGQPRSLGLVFFDQEEQGLLGSLAFTAEPERLRSLHSVVILDMLGASCETPGCQQYPEFLEQALQDQGQEQVLSDRGDFIAVVGEAGRPELLAAFGASPDGASKETKTTPLPDVLPVPVPFKGLLTPDVLRSDHAPFWLNGIGAVLVTDTANLRSPHYHQPSDDLANVDRDFFLGVAQQVVDGVWRLRQR